MRVSEIMWVKSHCKHPQMLALIIILIFLMRKVRLRERKCLSMVT